MYDGCHLYGMPFERREENIEEARAIYDPYSYPLYWRMRRHFRNRSWPYDYYRRGW
ncbi:MAG: hypothetical protein FWE05_00800 [Defluviitaleaceae bacterium]|nr:hypothetical protein [Defluviitaleaceae bacterium]